MRRPCKCHLEREAHFGYVGHLCSAGVCDPAETPDRRSPSPRSALSPAATIEWISTSEPCIQLCFLRSTINDSHPTQHPITAHHQTCRSTRIWQMKTASLLERSPIPSGRDCNANNQLFVSRLPRSRSPLDGQCSNDQQIPAKS